MESPALWEKLLIGVLAVVVILWFTPGIKASFRQRQEATQSEWLSVLIPIGLVALFVVLLIKLT